MSPFRKIRKAAAQVTNIHHAFSPTKKHVSLLKEVNTAVAGGAPQSPLPEDRLPGESSSSAAREEEKNEPSDTEEADEPAPAPALAEQKTFDSVPEEEKVWVLGYRLDNIFS